MLEHHSPTRVPLWVWVVGAVFFAIEASSVAQDSIYIVFDYFFPLPGNRWFRCLIGFLITILCTVVVVLCTNEATRHRQFLQRLLRSSPPSPPPPLLPRAEPMEPHPKDQERVWMTHQLQNGLYHRSHHLSP